MKVKIEIPSRKNFGGYWLFQRYFEAGVHEIEVTEAQLEELKRDAVAKLAQEAKPEVKAEAPKGKSKKSEE